MTLSEEIRQKIMADFTAGAASEPPEEDDEDILDPSESPAELPEESPEEVSSPAPQPPEQVPPPAPVGAPSQPDPRVADIETKLDTYNAQVQQILNRFEKPVQPEYQAPTGSYAGQELDPYFTTRDEIQQLLNPLYQRVKALGDIELGNRAGRLENNYAVAEAKFKADLGDDFDKYVNPEVRARALQNARNAVLKGEQKDSDINWTQLFQMEYQVNSHADMAAKLKEIREREEREAAQAAELKKVAAMPKGGNRHQPPAESGVRKGESVMDAMRRNVIAALRRA